MAPKKQKTARMIFMELLAQLGPLELRESYVRIIMALRGQSLQDVAKSSGGISYWYLSEAIKGRRPLSARMVKLLQSALAVDLTPFLTPEDGK